MFIATMANLNGAVFINKGLIDYVNIADLKSLRANVSSAMAQNENWRIEEGISSKDWDALVKNTRDDVFFEAYAKNHSVLIKNGMVPPNPDRWGGISTARGVAVHLQRDVIVLFSQGSGSDHVASSDVTHWCSPDATLPGTPGQTLYADFDVLSCSKRFMFDRFVSTVWIKWSPERQRKAIVLLAVEDNHFNVLLTPTQASALSTVWSGEKIATFNESARVSPTLEALYVNVVSSPGCEAITKTQVKNHMKVVGTASKALTPLADMSVERDVVSNHAQQHVVLGEVVTVPTAPLTPATATTKKPSKRQRKKNHPSAPVVDTRSSPSPETEQPDKKQRREVVGEGKKVAAINSDARAFAAKWDGDSVFVTCTVCEFEDGRAHMTRVDDRDASGWPTSPHIRALFKKISSEIAVRIEEDDVEGEDFYVKYKQSWDARIASPTSVLRVCNRCMTESKKAPKKGNVEAPSAVVENDDEPTAFCDSDEDDENEQQQQDILGAATTGAYHVAYVPKRAVVNNLYAGDVPSVFDDLNRVELSMVSLINPILTMTMLASNQYMGCKGTVFSVAKDVFKQAKTFPNMPTLESFAILRGRNQRATELEFRPRRVLAALAWLKIHNRFYRDATIDESLFGCDLSTLSYDDSCQLNEESVCIELDEDDVEDVDEAFEAESTRTATNNGTRGVEKDVLILLPDHCSQAVECQLREVLTGKPVHHVQYNDDEALCAPYTDTFFYEKCFPNLFPYGRGGPGDGHGLRNADHVKHMMTRGGDRRCQRSKVYIAVNAKYAIQSRVGGACVRASRGGLDEEVATRDDNDEGIPT